MGEFTNRLLIGVMIRRDPWYFAEWQRFRLVAESWILFSAAPFNFVCRSFSMDV